jgi:hypothetical protein
MYGGGGGGTGASVGGGNGAQGIIVFTYDAVAATKAYLGFFAFF